MSGVIVVQSRPRWAMVALYLALIGGGLGLLGLIRWQGQGLAAPAPPPGAGPAGRAAAGQVDVALHVMGTMAAVIALGYLLGVAFRTIGQPPVIGEVVAGLMLGPSLLGAISPGAMYALIPSA